MNSQTLKEFVERGGLEIRQRDQLVSFLLEHPKGARPDDIEYLARRVKTLEAYIESLGYCEAIRPRHEWKCFDSEIEQQIRKCLDAWEKEQQ